MARKNRSAVDIFRSGQASERCGEKAQRVGLRIFRRAGKNHGQRRWRHRKGLTGALDLKSVIAAHDFDAAGLQHAAVLVVEHWRQNFIAQPLFLRLPVDVEKRGIAARGAILQYIPPVAVLLTERHMVGHNVEHLPESDLFELSAEAAMTPGSSQLLIYFLMIDDIVSMRAPGGSLKIRRAIHMRDT